jgi:hypothetical protein
MHESISGNICEQLHGCTEAPEFSNDRDPIEPCKEITSFAIIERWQSNHSVSSAKKNKIL